MSEWLPERLKHLIIALKGKGASWSEIARATKLNVSTCQRYYCGTEAFKSEVIRLREEGLTWERIAMRCGASEPTCRKLYREKTALNR